MLAGSALRRPTTQHTMVVKNTARAASTTLAALPGSDDLQDRSERQQRQAVDGDAECVPARSTVGRTSTTRVAMAIAATLPIR